MEGAADRLAALLRVTTRTPFTFAAADVTEIWPVPGPEADSSPRVAKYVQLRTSTSKTTWYWPAPVLSAEVTARPRTRAPALETTPCRVMPSASAAAVTLPIFAELSFEASSDCSLQFGPNPSGFDSLPRSVPSLKSRLRIEPLMMSSEPIVATACRRRR